MFTLRQKIFNLNLIKSRVFIGIPVILFISSLIISCGDININDPDSSSNDSTGNQKDGNPNNDQDDGQDKDKVEESGYVQPTTPLIISINDKILDIGLREPDENFADPYTVSHRHIMAYDVELTRPTDNNEDNDKGWEKAILKVILAEGDEQEYTIENSNCGDDFTLDATFARDFSFDICEIAIKDKSGAQWVYTVIPVKLISTQDDFDYLISRSSRIKGNFKLLTDIDTGHRVDSVFSRYEDGVFDGNGHKVKIDIVSSSFNGTGLFGSIGHKTTVKNLIVNGQIISNGACNIGGAVGIVEHYGRIVNITANVSITGGGSSAGGLVGFLRYGADIISSSASVNIVGNRRVGGLVGESWGNVIESSASGEVQGIDQTGGLVGKVGYSGNIISSTSSAYVTSSSRTGGLVGTMRMGGKALFSSASGKVHGNDTIGGLIGMLSNGSRVSFSSASGLVTGDANVGGLIGHSFAVGRVISSYATGNVEGTGYSVGGLVGRAQYSSTIQTSYALGDVVGEGHVGGLTGDNYNESNIISSYAAGTVTGTGYSGFSVGGLVGFVSANVTNSHYINPDDNIKISDYGWTEPWLDLTDESGSMPYLAAPTDDSMSEAAKKKWVSDQQEALDEFLHNRYISNR